MDYKTMYDRVNFIIENNIIKGIPKPYCMKTHNLGKVILNILDSNLNYVSQIETETGKHTTFAEMKDRSIRCALWLKKQGIGSGDISLVCTDNQIHAYIPELATFYVGAAHNPWHHDVTLKSARHLMQLIQSKVIFSCENTVDVLVLLEIRRKSVSWFFITTDMINVFNKSQVFKKYELKSLKLIQTGGSKINQEVFEEFQNDLPHTLVIQGYGMCELGGTATMQNEKRKKVNSGGFVIEHVQVKIVDLTTGESLGPNQSGELYCKSPTMMLCYYKDPEATKETVDEEGWIHSGDKAYYDEDGEVFIVERLKQVMKFRAYHISPSEIEEVLLSHPAVMEVAVVPIPHELDGERPMAFVAKVPGSEVTEEELIELSATLGEYKKLWGGVKFLEQLPHTPSAKIARTELVAMAKDLAKQK